MKKIMSKQIIGVLALLASSASMAATVTVTSSNLNPTIGQLFTITLTGTFTVGEDMVAGTMDWGWNAGRATIQHSLANAACALCLTGSPQVGAGSFIVLRPTTFDVLPGAAPPVSGVNFGIAKFDFLATAAGALNFFVTDDGGNLTGWFDQNAGAIPVQYSQANIVIQAAPPVPVPAAAWLLISALGSMVVLKRRPL